MRSGNCWFGLSERLLNLKKEIQEKRDAVCTQNEMHVLSFQSIDFHQSMSTKKQTDNTHSKGVLLIPLTGP